MTNEDNKRHNSHNPRAVQGCFLLYQLFFYACSTFPSPNAILYSQAAQSGFWPAKFRNGFFSMERIITYTISTGESGQNVLGFLRKKGFSKHILTTMKRAEQAILLNGQPAFGRTVLEGRGMFFGALFRRRPGTDRSLPLFRCRCLWISCMRMRISLC